ncbi:MAG: hypothetical protein Q8P20_03660 [bacterium]|nr:hypothetical protein [bacterium]
MKNQRGFIPIVVVIIVSVLAIGFAGVAVYYEMQKDEVSTTSNTVVVNTNMVNTNINTSANTNVSTNTNIAVNINSVDNINVDVEETSCSDGWSTYMNDQYGYTVMYPSTATITLLEENSFSLTPEEYAEGLTFAEKFATYGEELCVSIKLNDTAYVNIAAPENYEAGVICHRSGVGVIMDQVERSDSLTIEGVNYTGSGNIYISEDPTTGLAGTTLMYKNETNHATLIDETSIEYGSTPAEDVLYTTYEDLRDTLICIMESYTSIY